MRYHHYLFCLFCVTFFKCGGFEYHDSESSVSNFSVDNACWLTPSDGTLPSLISYDAMFDLSDGKTLLLNIDSSYLNEYFISPTQFAKNDDKIKILREGFHPEEEGKSWFEVENESKGWSMVLKGNSLKQKNTHMLPMKQQGFFHVILPTIRKSTSSDAGMEYVFNLHNTTLILPIDNDKFHDFYDSMIVKTGNIKKSTLDQYGNYFYDVELILHDSGDVVKAKTVEFNSNKEGYISSIVELKDQYKIILEDNHELLINFIGTLNEFEQNFGTVGDALLMQENYIKGKGPGYSTHWEPDACTVRLSLFAIENVNSGKTFKTLPSPQRKERSLSIVTSYDYVFKSFSNSWSGPHANPPLKDYVSFKAREGGEIFLNLKGLSQPNNLGDKMNFYALMPISVTNLGDNKQEIYFPDSKIRLLISFGEIYWNIEKITEE